MSISRIASGATTYSTGNPAPATPAHLVGDMLILAVGTKPDTTPATTPSGWSLLGVANGGTGTTGIDTGPMRVGLFYKIATTTTESPGAITVTGNNVSAAQVHVYRKTNSAAEWNIAGVGAADTTTGTPHSVVMPTNPGLTVGDFLLAVGVIPTDVGAGNQFTAQTVAAAGMTTVTLTEVNEWTTATGSDMGGWLANGAVVTGTSTGNPTVSATASGTTTNVHGPIYLVRMRELVPTAKSASDTSSVSIADVASTSVYIPPPTNYLLRQTFEGGTPGPVMVSDDTRKGGDRITVGGGSTTNVYATGAAVGTHCYYDNATVASYVRWFGLDDWGQVPPTTSYIRFYMKIPAAPSSLRRIVTADSSTGTVAAALNITTAGLLQSRDNVGIDQTSSGTSGTVPYNQWFRIEMKVVHSATVGTIEVRLFKNASATSPDATIVSAAANKNTGDMAFDYKIGNVNAVAQEFWMDDVAVGSTDWIGPAENTNMVLDRWVGAVTDTTATVSFNTLGVTSGRLRYSTNSNMSSPTLMSFTAPNSNGITKFNLTGLTANTTYYFDYEDSTGMVYRDDLTAGSFKTFVVGTAHSFSFATSSCSQSGNSVNSIEHAGNRNPLFFLHTGDLHYENPGANTQSLFHNGYRVQFAKATYRKAMKNVPMDYVWDDHDSGGNDADVNSVALPAGHTVYRERVPHYTLPSSDVLYHTFVVGRCRFVVLDCRSKRSPGSNTDNSSKTILGSVQKQWLKDTLAAATEPVKFIVTPMVWNGTDATEDTWARYQTERTELINWFVANSINGLYFISGDSHTLAADDGTNTPGGYPAVQASPLDNASSDKGGGPWSNGRFPALGGVPADQYAWITITDAGGNVTIDYAGRDYNTNTDQITMQTIISPGGGTVNKSASDTSSISVSDNSANVVQVSASDSSSVAASDVSSFGTTAVAASDTSSLSTSDISSVQAQLARTESGSISVADTSSFATVAVTGSDTSSVSGSDISSVAPQAAGQDTSSIAVSDIAQVSVSASASDTGSVSIAEAVARTASVTGTDTSSVQISEVVVTRADRSTSDTGSVSVAESVSTHASNNRTETGAISVSDTASVTGVAQVTDSSAISVGEQTAVFVPVTTSDTASVIATDTAAQFYVTASGADAAQITVSDAQNTVSGFGAADSGGVALADTSAFSTVAISASDTSSLVLSDAATLDKNIPGADTSSLSVSESVQIRSSIVASDFGAVAVADQASIKAIIQSAESNSVSVSELTTTSRILSSADSSTVAIGEGVTNSSYVQASDAGPIVVAESTSTGTYFIANDTSAIEISEQTSTDAHLLATDFQSVGAFSEVETVVGLNVADSTDISVVEQGEPTADRPGADTGAVAVQESAEIFVSGDQSIASSDSVAVSASDYAFVDASFEDVDSGAVAASESISFGQVDFSSEDTSSIAISDDSINDATSLGSDASTLVVDDQAHIFVERSTEDTSSVSVDDTQSTITSLSSSDDSTVSTQEQSATSATIDAYDSMPVIVTDLAAIEMSLSASDSAEVSASDVALVAVYGIASDDLSVQISDQATVDISLSPTDSLVVSLIESATTFVTLQANDQSAISTAESASPQLDRPGLDSGSVVVTETSSIAVFGSMSNSSSDQAAMAASDYATIAIQQSASDQASLSVAESTQFGTIVRNVTDTLGLSLSEQASIDIQGLLDKPGFDGSGISVAESVSITTSRTRADSGVISVADAANILKAGTAEISASDTLSIGAVEHLAVGGEQTFEPTDTLSISATDQATIFILPEGPVYFDTSGSRGTITETSVTAQGEITLESSTERTGKIE